MVASGARQRSNRRGLKATKHLDALKSSSSDASLLVTHDSSASRSTLRRGLASLHVRLCAAVNSGNRRPTAGSALKPKAPKLLTDDRLTLDQVWGQLSVVYAPVLKAIEANTRRLEASGTGANGTSTDAANSKKISSKRSAPAADLDGVSSDAADSSDDGLESIRAALGKQKKGASRGKGGANSAGVDDWRYALGKPGEVDEDEDDILGEADPKEFDDAEDDDDAADDDGAAGSRQGKDDFGSDDGEGDQEEDMDMEGDDEEADDEEDDGSDRAALREMYGDDVSDDAQLFDDEMADFVDEEQAEEAEEGEEGEEEYGGGGDEPYDANSSPFGPDMAPVNPLDFADIDADLTLTSFERNEKKRLRILEDAEQKRVLGQHWTMQGEVAASARPRDSLAEETLEFDHALRPAPVITEHFTSKLEDRIKKRIIDSNFDDVERKVARTLPSDLDGPKHDPEVDAQKSKLSLMDLYEKEYLEKQAAAEAGVNNTAEPLTEIERDELKAVQMWKRLSQHLDALSNFYFTPKPVNPELDARVRATTQQAPAISIEAVGLSALSKDKILAPQDVFRPKRQRFADVADTELLPAERRAIRRTAKANTKAAEGRKEKQQAVKAKAQPPKPKKK